MNGFTATNRFGYDRVLLFPYKFEIFAAGGKYSLLSHVIRMAPMFSIMLWDQMENEISLIVSEVMIFQNKDSSNIYEDILHIYEDKLCSVNQSDLSTFGMMENTAQQSC